MNFINFNEHITQSKLNVYGGSEKKKTAILDDGKQYMLKFPDPTREIHREISYINNAISEYIGCHIFQLTGFEVQNTILGTFTDENGKTKVACACEDIRKNGDILFEMEKIELELIDSKENLTFDNVKKILSRINGIDADEYFKEYCNRFIIDALIGNTDRHNGNWGIIENSGIYKIAPVYDCGSSFSPLFTDDELTPKIISNESINVMSAVSYDNGKRICYRDYLLSCENTDINNALTEIVPKINLYDIYDMIDEIPYISDVRKDFYKQLLQTRYDKILIPALENVLGIEKSLEYKQWNSAVIDYIYSNGIKPFEELPETGTEIELAEIQINGEVYPLYYIKNNNMVFFMNEDGFCEGMASLKKSNLNICKFVQSARAMGIDIDTDSIRKFINKKTDYPDLD